MKRLAMLLLMFACTLTRGAAQSPVSCFTDSLYSSSTDRFMKFFVVLPEGYNETQERYTTVYLLHGLWGSYKDWVTNTGLVAYAAHHRFIIITPDGQNSWWTNSTQVKHAMYEDYIIKDLIPFVDQKYRTLATRHGRAIAGLSMGGYGTMKFALRYPGTFFYAASFSGALSVVPDMEESLRTMDPSSVNLRSRVEAFGAERSAQWTRNDVMTLVDSADVKQLPYLYLSVGHSDYLVNGTLAFSAKLRKKNAAFEMHEMIGAHTWLFWDQEISTVLEKIERYDPLNVK